MAVGLRDRVTQLRERAGEADEAEIERAINDVHAARIALEATRARVSRRLRESVPDALEPGGPERLRDYAESLRALDGDMDALRGLLRELLALPVEPARPGA